MLAANRDKVKFTLPRGATRGTPELHAQNIGRYRPSYMRYHACLAMPRLGQAWYSYLAYIIEELVGRYIRRYDCSSVSAQRANSQI